MLAALVIVPTLPAADQTALKPLLAVPDKVVLQEDYSQPKKLAAEIYSIRQGTQWAIEDGVLRGRPSPPEYQAKKQTIRDWSLGYRSRPVPEISSSNSTFASSAASRRRVFHLWSSAITWLASRGPTAARRNLLADNESVLLATVPGFKIEDGRWYRAVRRDQG